MVFPDSLQCSPQPLLSRLHKESVGLGEMDEAFICLRESLCNRVILYVPVLLDVFILCTDASGGGVGACLHVVRDQQELPVAFYSRQLRGVERTYTVTELESLAIVAAILHFDFYLYGASFIVYTDHRACTSLLSSSHLNRRLMRMALKLQGREVDVRYRPGKDNTNADGLSRQDWDEHDLQEPQPGGSQPGQMGSGLAEGPVGLGLPPKTRRKK